jgi:hypothetical protein
VCSSTSGWLSEKDAVRHETGKRHVQNVRVFDVLPRELAEAPTSQAVPTSAAFPAGPLSQDASPNEFVTIHRPALEDDSPNALYDDFAGTLAQDPSRPAETGPNLQDSGSYGSYAPCPSLPNHSSPRREDPPRVEASGAVDISERPETDVHGEAVAVVNPPGMFLIFSGPHHF